MLATAPAMIKIKASRIVSFTSPMAILARFTIL